jgi:hypothetical protein
LYSFIECYINFFISRGGNDMAAIISGSNLAGRQVPFGTLGGYIQNTTGDSAGAYLGMPTLNGGGADNFNITAADVTAGAALSSQFVGASGSIIAALNAAVSAGTYTEGAGIDISNSNVISLDIATLTAETIASGDFLAFQDVTDNGNHKETVDDLATLFAGSGLAASSAVMSLDISEYSEVTPAASDAFLTLDSDNSNEQLTTTDALATLFAGSGLAAASAVMALDISEYSEVTPAASDAFLTLDSDNSNEQLTTTDALATLFAGDGLSASSAVMALDLNELTGAVADVGADSIAFVDATDNSTKKESIADLVESMVAGNNGLSSASGVMSVARKTDGGIDLDGDELVIGGKASTAVMFDENILSVSGHNASGDQKRFKFAVDGGILILTEDSLLT